MKKNISVLELENQAVDAFEKGFNCSQSVFLAFSGRFGIPQETALLLASPFGGGLGRSGEVCGAVSGAVMALGLKYGFTSVDNPDSKTETYGIIREFLDAFREENGSLRCPELLGCDLGTEEGSTFARENELHRKVCQPLVIHAVRRVHEFLDER